MPNSAVDSVSPALHHTKQQLFRPFQFGQWTRLAFVGLFAGELSSGGGCNFHVPSSVGTSQRRDLFAFPHVDPVLLIPLVILALIAVPLLWLAFLYVSSRMRFVLFDSIIAKRCEVGRMWRARRGPAMQYFVWQIVFSLVTLAGMALIVGPAALIAFLLGWFTAPREHLAVLVLAGLAVFAVFMCWLLLSLVVHVFTKDFVVPQMAIEGLTAFDGWRRLLALVNREKAGYAGYAGMKLVMAMGAAFAITVASVILVLLLLIPIGGLGVISVLLGGAAGLTWNLLTITGAIVAGCILLLMILYLVSLISAPVIVFFPAYAIYFFAPRYPLLAKLIYPAPPAPPPVPAISPHPEPAV